jgi:GDSL-like lipase/acylhydrolase family protein/salicyl acyltransferaes SsfX3-like protein
MAGAAMKAVALENGPIAIVGALDFDRSPTGISPRRLPAWTRPQIPDVFMNSMVAMASGVRLTFTTDAHSIELDVMATTFRYSTMPARAPVCQLVVNGAAAVDAVVDSASYFVLDPMDPTNIGFDVGSPATLRFDGLGIESKACEIWLPQTASVELQALRVEATAAVSATPSSGRRRWLHYGSSISHCMEANGPTSTWPAVAARLADVDLFSLGLAGECMLDHFVARTIRDRPANAISLKLGINIVNADAMIERTFIPAVHGLLDTIRDGHPATPILVVSPIFCPSVEDQPGPTTLGADGTFGTAPAIGALREGALTLRRIREILDGIVAARRDAGDVNLAYLDGLELFGADDVDDLPDLLHPNDDGYRRIGERFAALAFGPGGHLQ